MPKNKISVHAITLLITLSLACKLTGGEPRATPPEILADTFFSGCAYLDNNQNGEMDADDTPLSALTFTVTLAGGGGFGSQTNETGCATVTVPGGASEDFYPLWLEMVPEDAHLYVPIHSAQIVLEYPDTKAAFLFAASDSNTPSTDIPNTFDPQKLGTVERKVPYCHVDGRPLPMDVYYPDEAGQAWPVTVYVHGGGWSSGDKTAGAGIRFIEPLRKAGFLVVSVNYRLSPEYQFPAHIEDVKCAIRHLRAQAAVYNLDPDRIGAFGGSAGGHLVSLLGTSDASAELEGSGEYQKYSSRVQAVVDMFGPVDSETLCHPTVIEKVFGVTTCQAEIITTASPLTHISADDPPFLILHGDRDNLLPVSQSEILLEALTEAGVPASLIVIENAGHGFHRPDGDFNPDMDAILQIVVDFFTQHLSTDS